MKVMFNEKEFFEKLAERVDAAGALPLYDTQLEALRKLLYEGLDLQVQPDGLEVDCGILKIEAVNGRAEKLQPGEPVLSNMFIMPGFPLEQNVTKLSIAFDATVSKPVLVDMTIFPFKFGFPVFKKAAGTA